MRSSSCSLLLRHVEAALLLGTIPRWRAHGWLVYSIVGKVFNPWLLLHRHDFQLSLEFVHLGQCLCGLLGVIDHGLREHHCVFTGNGISCPRVSIRCQGSSSSFLQHPLVLLVYTVPEVGPYHAMSRVFLEPDGQCFCIEMAMCSEILHDLANHLDVGVSAAAFWMGGKEELCLFYLEHHDFRGSSRSIGRANCTVTSSSSWALGVPKLAWRHLQRLTKLG